MPTFNDYINTIEVMDKAVGVANEMAAMFVQNDVFERSILSNIREQDDQIARNNPRSDEAREGAETRPHSPPRPHVEYHDFMGGAES